MKIRAIDQAELPAARDLLAASLPHDRIDVTAGEKLFGDNGARRGTVLGAFDDQGLGGVIATAGRWIKVLAVREDARRRGVGTALLAALAEHGAAGPYRVADHPGNYVSPGIDRRYEAGRAFFAARGFRVVGEVENIRVPLADNPLVTAARLTARWATAAAAGYECRRARAEESAALGEWIGRAFAPVWAFEARRALAGPCQALHVAVHNNSYVAFAAADGNNQGLGWFGPAGTDSAHRGRGLGETLLLACLLDVAALPEGGVIAWIGPKAFYQKAAGAIDDRRFVQMDQKS